MELSKKDGKAFWNILDKFEKKVGDGIFKECISGDSWVNHFKSLLQCQKIENTQPPLNHVLK